MIEVTLPVRDVETDVFVHPNQMRHALARFPAVVRRPEHRDEFGLRLALADPAADRAALEAGVREAVKQVCRVSVDRVDFVEALPAEAPNIVDERSWE